MHIDFVTFMIGLHGMRGCCYDTLNAIFTTQFFTRALARTPQNKQKPPTPNNQPSKPIQIVRFIEFLYAFTASFFQCTMQHTRTNKCIFDRWSLHRTRIMCLKISIHSNTEMKTIYSGMGVLLK